MTTRETELTAQVAALEQVESEPVAWCLAYDDPNLKLRIHSNSTMCEAEIDAHVKGLNGALSKVPLYTTPQPDRTAELEAALKVAKAALNRAADKFHDYAEIHAAKEASPENDLKVERNLMLSSDMDKALAKINEVLKP